MSPQDGRPGYRVILLMTVMMLLTTVGCAANQPTLPVTGGSSPTSQPTRQPAPTGLSESAAVSERTPSPVPQATVTPTPDAPTPLPNPNGLSFRIGEPIDAVEAQLFAAGYAIEEIRTTMLNDVTWQAKLYHHPDSLPFANPKRLLLFKEESDGTVLSYDLLDDIARLEGFRQSSEDFENIFAFVQFEQYSVAGAEVTGWHDMNRDGRPELAVFIGDGSNGWVRNQIQVLQLHPSEGIVNLTQSVPPEDKLDLNDFGVSRLEDVDKDGLVEWLVTDARFELWLCHACSPSSIRIYAWDGQTYRNRSAQFPAYYQPIIDQQSECLDRLDFSAVGENDLASFEYNLGCVMSLILAYENAGRLEEGRAILEMYDPARFEGVDKYASRWWNSNEYFSQVWQQFKAAYDASR